METISLFWQRQVTHDCSAKTSTSPLDLTVLTLLSVTQSSCGKDEVCYDLSGVDAGRPHGRTRGGPSSWFSIRTDRKRVVPRCQGGDRRIQRKRRKKGWTEMLL
ncbi:uncharacterized protein [Pagrus major]|uniref:uncharacterized protein n=1 Tax=Pagrus major TaxID=143350 RepID=UPI003CC864BC